MPFRRHCRIQRSIMALLCVCLLPIMATASGNLLMFSTDYCPACEAAKRYFQERGIEYTEYNLNESKRAREAYERLGGRGTPVLFINGQSMNGFHPQRFREFWLDATGEPVPDSAQR